MFRSVFTQDTVFLLVSTKFSGQTRSSIFLYLSLSLPPSLLPSFPPSINLGKEGSVLSFCALSLTSWTGFPTWVTFGQFFHLFSFFVLYYLAEHASFSVYLLPVSVPTDVSSCLAFEKISGSGGSSSLWEFYPWTFCTLCRAASYSFTILLVYIYPFILQVAD